MVTWTDDDVANLPFLTTVKVAQIFNDRSHRVPVDDSHRAWPNLSVTLSRSCCACLSPASKRLIWYDDARLANVRSELKAITQTFEWEWQNALRDDKMMRVPKSSSQ